MDVVKEAIDEGRRQFPVSHWVHYDRYNCSFNPEGTADIPIPDLGVEFDFIVAYSVFTHIAREEMHDLGVNCGPVSVVGNAGFYFHRPSSLELAGNLRRQQPAMAIGIGPWDRNLYRCRRPSRGGSRHGLVPWWTAPNCMSRATASTARASS